MADQAVNHRILTIDDSPAIQADYRKLLCPSRPSAAELDRFESSLLGEQQAIPSEAGFEVDSALQGEEALALVRRAGSEGRPYSMAFVDMRMPPGWDGLQTIEAIWRDDADLEIVICTAFSDYSPEQIMARLGASDQLLILKKPFDPMEVRQLAHALTEKWMLRQLARLRLAELERRVATRTRELSASNLLLVTETQNKGKLQAELERAQRLESLVKLTLGCAHELDASLRTLASSVDYLRLHAPAVWEPRQQEQEQEPAPAPERAVTQALTSAELATKRMANLVHGMMKLGKEDQPADPILDVNRALASVVEVMGEGIHGCAELTVDFGVLPEIECSPADVNLVLLGLIDSAVQAVEAAKSKTGRAGHIAISTRLDCADAVISIADSGEGIPEKIHAEIFAPFSTVDAAGTGVRRGLAAAWSIIVKQHGGKLTLDSDGDRGTTIVVRLPLRSQDRQQPVAAS